MKRKWMSLLLAAATLLMAVAACSVATVPPTRTLPGHIKRIYIREFKNNSPMYGVQADLTLAVNDEFMSDGRLDVVQNDRADVRLEGRVKSVRVVDSALGEDRFPTVISLQMIAVIELWDPYDPDRLAPMSRYTVPAVVSYVSDPRLTTAETDTDARARLVQQMAKNIVYAVITGAPEVLKPEEQGAIQRYQQRRGPEQYEPVIPQPRFPKPTPVPFKAE